MDGHPEEPLHLSLLAHDGHAMHQRHRVQQVTEVHKGPGDTRGQRSLTRVRARVIHCKRSENIGIKTSKKGKGTALDEVSVGSVV